MTTETHLTRAEIMTLVYDKLQIISAEMDAAQDGEDNPARFRSLKPRLKRVVVEARRAASLIETYERHWTAGHCLHCGKSYQEHDEQRAQEPLEASVRVRIKGEESGPPRCRALRALFESMEIETYQALKLEDANL